MTARVDISVVIPTVNRTNLLRDTVASVLGQTRPVREILVVDNGTGNAAAQALAGFGDAVTLLRVPPEGKQIARNAGLRHAASRWVAFLDDDDLLLPTYIERVEQAMAIGAADVIGTDHRKFSAEGDDARTNLERAPAGYWDGMPIAERDGRRHFHGRFPLDRLLRRVPIYPSMTVVRRDFALALGGYDARMRGIMSEDLEFLVRVLTAGTLTLILEPLVRYRVHPGNDTADAEARRIGRWRIFEFVRATHPNLPDYFAAALDRDLPRRRAHVFDLSYGSQYYGLMTAIAPSLRLRDWTPKRCLRYLAGTLFAATAGRSVSQ